MYSAVRFVKPAPVTGEMVAVVRAARGDKPVPGTRIEVLTPEDALIATLTASDDGRARHVLTEGSYRLRASAPTFNAQTRVVQVRRGGTAEVRFQLAQQPRPESGARPVSRSVGAAQRFLHRLGL